MQKYVPHIPDSLTATAIELHFHLRASFHRKKRKSIATEISTESGRRKVLKVSAIHSEKQAGNNWTAATI